MLYVSLEDKQFYYYLILDIIFLLFHTIKQLHLICKYSCKAEYEIPCPCFRVHTYKSCNKCIWSRNKVIRALCDISDRSIYMHFIKHACMVIRFDRFRKWHWRATLQPLLWRTKSSNKFCCLFTIGIMHVQGSSACICCAESLVLHSWDTSVRYSSVVQGVYLNCYMVISYIPVHEYRPSDLIHFIEHATVAAIFSALQPSVTTPCVVLGRIMANIFTMLSPLIMYVSAVRDNIL